MAQTRVEQRPGECRQVPLSFAGAVGLRIGELLLSRERNLEEQVVRRFAALIKIVIRKANGDALRVVVNIDGAG